MIAGRDMKQVEKPSGINRIAFWIVWTILLLTVPFYIFTMWFEGAVVKHGQILTYLSPAVGFLVFIAQIAVFVMSYKQMKQDLPLSKPFLTLLGGSILLAFIWAGGCIIMGDYRVAG